MTRFLFVRHGVTEHTGHKLSGLLPGIHLTDEGRAQAFAAAEYLADTTMSAIYSSPIERCRETAEIIAARHDVPLRMAEGLGEVGYGAWSGRSFRSVRRLKMWQVVQRRPSAVVFPEGETLRAVQARSVDTVEEMAARHPKQTICCVAHADVIKLVVAHYLGVHIDLFQRIAIAPASVSGVSVDGPDVRVLTVNTVPPGAQDDGAVRS